MDLNTDFSYMTDEELDELISRIKEARERRSESRKTDLWNNIRRAVNNYIMDFGMIELFTEDHSFMLDADSFSIPRRNQSCGLKQKKGSKKMDVQTAKEFLERRSVDDLQSIIVLAQQRIQQIRENQQAKYMGAIRKAFEDYFENVGPIEVTFGYEDADGMESAATIEVNSDNPPCFCQQSIEFP